MNGGGSARTQQVRRRSEASAPQQARVTPDDLAWLVAVPVAVVVLLAIVVLGPPLGGLLADKSTTFWSSLPEPLILPEPTEQARFLLALTAPLLLSAALIAARRRPWRMSAETAHLLAQATQFGLLAFVVVCFMAQRDVTYGIAYTFGAPSFHRQYFTFATLGVALVLAAGLVAAVRSDTVRARFAVLTRESRPRAAGAAGAAVVFLFIWLLHAINTEASVAHSTSAIGYHTRFVLDEMFAVLDGRSPLVNYVAQYGALLTYAGAGALALLGTSTGVFTGTMVATSGLALLGVYGILRRVARSAVVGLLLFAPFLATALYMEHGPPDKRYTVATLYGAYPLRFAGVWLLAWLTARHLDGARPRRSWPLFLAAGLVMLNNTDHGIPAAGATVAALLWAQAPVSRAGLRRLALACLAGLAAAFALVSVLTLARAGQLPHPQLLFRYASLFARSGFGMLPMPTLGLHLVVYLTFVAAIGMATSRAVAGEPDRLLTGMLVWSGVFGLGAASYFAGRSHPDVLITSFSVWALAIILMTVAIVRQLASQPSRRPSPAAFACLFAFAVAVCSLPQTPKPWTQLQRIGVAGPATYAHPLGEGFVDYYTHPGEHVSIFIALGHRIADDVGITDITPYTGIQSMPALKQLDETIAMLRREHGRKIFYWTQDAPPELGEALQQRGYKLTAQDSGTGLTLWTDRT